MGGSLARSALIRVCKRKLGCRKQKLEVNCKGICHVSREDPVQLRIRSPGPLSTCLRSLKNLNSYSGFSAVVERGAVRSILVIRSNYMHK